MTKTKLTYEHFGRIGDIWKQLPLVDVLTIERPSPYVETNSSRAAYPMDCDWRRRLGIGHFLQSDQLATTAYGEWERASLAAGRYLGSPALAMKALGNACDQYVFCDRDAASLSDIRRFAAQFGFVSRVETLCGDSRSSPLHRLTTWGRETFVHIDPFDLFAVDDHGRTYAGLFNELTTRGVKVFLCYGYGERDPLEKWWTSSASRIRGTSRFEVELEPFGALPPDKNPGVTGCGIVVANLSDKAVARMRQDHDPFCMHYRRVKVESRIYRFIGGKQQAAS